MYLNSLTNDISEIKVPFQSSGNFHHGETSPTNDLQSPSIFSVLSKLLYLLTAALYKIFLNYMGIVIIVCNVCITLEVFHLSMSPIQCNVVFSLLVDIGNCCHTPDKLSSKQLLNVRYL